MSKFLISWANTNNVYESEEIEATSKFIAGCFAYEKLAEVYKVYTRGLNIAQQVNKSTKSGYISVKSL